jgi:hypothetical protein
MFDPDVVVADHWLRTTDVFYKQIFFRIYTMIMFLSSAQLSKIKEGGLYLF